MMNRRWAASAGLAAVAAVVAACGSSPSPGSKASPGVSTSEMSPAATASGAALKTREIKGVTVVTDSKGFTLYWFAPDTPSTSKCTGTCAAIWPPVKGPAAAGPGVTGKLDTLTRTGGSVQATYNGHPLYTYTADTAPGQAHGNGVNLNGGVWHEVTASVTAASPGASPSSAGSGGY